MDDLQTVPRPSQLSRHGLPDTPPEVRGVGAALSEDGLSVLVSLQLDRSPELNDQTVHLHLSPPAAAVLARKLSSVIRKYLHPPLDDSEQQST